mmetsp:Transcript_11685/g.28720  ORF Transcript_11685/g.28720 Transcript_11685/m.28720 type:complete len:83 (+) Transcript_11685:1000-1248(+)
MFLEGLVFAMVTNLMITTPPNWKTNIAKNVDKENHIQHRQICNFKKFCTAPVLRLPSFFFATFVAVLLHAKPGDLQQRFVLP